MVVVQYDDRAAGLAARARQRGRGGRAVGPAAVRAFDPHAGADLLRVEGAFPLVGVGGIDSGETAIAKIKAGATLVQLYTGLVFRGLGLLSEIKSELAAALKRGRRTSLSALVGVDAAEMTAESWPS